MNFELDTLRLLIDKTQSEPPLEPFLDERYAEVAEQINHPNLYYKLFYLISEELKPDVVVELGGWRGYGAAHFAAGNPDGLVITIDHHSDPGDDLNQIKMEECVKQYPNMHYVKGWTTPEYVEETNKGVNGYGKVLEILDGKKVDILFIDSWHEGRYFLRDWNYYRPLLNNPALVICDDLYDTELFIDMEKTWHEMPYEKFVDGGMHPGIPMGFLKYE
jgi:predicted O-methyltransferase YrrM